MATSIPTKLFFSSGREYGVGSITFDLILNEAHYLNNRVSSHPVEDGSKITDHIENELLNGNLSGLITNFSLNVFGLRSNRAQDAFEEMERLWESRELVTIVTVMRVYENVAISSVSVARSADTGEAIVLAVTFQQIRRVKLKRVNLDVNINVPDMKDDTSRQASPPANIGRTVGESDPRTEYLLEKVK